MNKLLTICLISPLLIFSCAKQAHVEIINSDENKGEVTKGGNFNCQSILILDAKPKTGYLFTGWYKENNTPLSFQNPYIYTVPDHDSKITAIWEEYSTQSFVFNMHEETLTYSISHYHGSTKEVIVPSTHYGFKVTAIDGATFAHNHVVESLKIHDEITYIGDYAFEDVSLKTITLPKNLKTVERNAFTTWQSNQIINIHKSSFSEETMTTTWSWVLNKVVEKEETYYTCERSGSAHIKLID